MNPVEAFLDMEKVAGIGDLIRKLRPPPRPPWKDAVTIGAVSAGATALAAIGASQLQQGIQAAHDAVSRSISYKRMLNDNPDLRKMDGKKSRRYFDTMYRVAPEIAKDTLASGSWVKGVDSMGMDYVNPQMLQTLSFAEAKVRERRMKPMIDPFQLAQGATSAGVDYYKGARTFAENKPSTFQSALNAAETGVKVVNMGGKLHDYVTHPNRKPDQGK